MAERLKEFCEYSDDHANARIGWGLLNLVHLQGMFVSITQHR